MPSEGHLQRSMLVVDSSSLPQVHPARASLKADEVCVGCIVWLPHKSGSRHVGVFGKRDEIFNAKGYHHPAVIVSIKSPSAPKYVDDLEICFVLLTTFGGLDISDYIVRRTLLPASIPVFSTVNSDESPCLHLERSKTLRKQSYVRLDNIYETNLSTLRSYNNNSAIELPAYNWRLDEDSYRKLMSLLHLTAQEYAPIEIMNSLKKTHNASIPLAIPVPTTSQELRNTRVTTHALGPTATQDQRNAPISTCGHHPATSQNLQHTPMDIYPPGRAPSWAPQLRSNNVDSVGQDYHAILANPPHLPPLHPNYSDRMQLPPPTTHRAEHHRGSHPGELAVALVFCFFVLWLLVACAGWLIWRMFGI